MNLLLRRSIDDGERTTGILQVNGRVFATLERPWTLNIQ